MCRADNSITLTKLDNMNKKIKMGLVGGGPGSFIGPVHSGQLLWMEKLNSYVGL
jgi:hypothetical protein